MLEFLGTIWVCLLDQAHEETHIQGYLDFQFQVNIQGKLNEMVTFVAALNVNSKDLSEFHIENLAFRFLSSQTHGDGQMYWQASSFILVPVYWLFSPHELVVSFLHLLGDTTKGWVMCAWKGAIFSHKTGNCNLSNWIWEYKEVEYERCAAEGEIQHPVTDRSY